MRYAANVGSSATIADGSVTPSKESAGSRYVQNQVTNQNLCDVTYAGAGPKTYDTVGDETQAGTDKYVGAGVKLFMENDDVSFELNNSSPPGGSGCSMKFTKTANAGKFMVSVMFDKETAMAANTYPLSLRQIMFKSDTNRTFRMGIIQDSAPPADNTLENPFISTWNADGTDPTPTGSGILEGVIDINATTSWQTALSVSGPTFTNSAKGIAIWSDDDVPVNGTLEIAAPLWNTAPATGATTLQHSILPSGNQISQDMRFAEKSYENTTEPGTVTTTGQVVFTMADADHSFFIPFRQRKLKVPTISLFSPDDGAGGREGTGDEEVYNSTGAANITSANITVSDVSTLGFTITIDSQTAGDVIAFHWVADSGV